MSRSILKTVSLLLQLFLSTALLSVINSLLVIFWKCTNLYRALYFRTLPDLARDGGIRGIIVSEIKLALNDPAVFAVKTNWLLN